MTYEQLKKIIEAMSAEDRQKSATVYVDMIDEYLPITGIDFTNSECDVLDNSHPILIV